MKRAIAILALAAMLSPAASARGASVFSMVLLGERLENGETRAISLGGANQLLSDSLGVLQVNPALLADLTRVTIGVTNVMAADVGRSSELSERDVSVAFPAVKVAFPIMGGFVLSTGYLGRFAPDGGFTLSDTTSAGVFFVSRFTKSGGLFSLPLTAAFDVTRFASVGVTFSLEHGYVQERWDKEFAALLFAPGAGFKKETLDGVGYSAGLVLKPSERLMVGGMFESQIDYDTDVEVRYTDSSLDTTYTSTATLPARTSVGVTIGVTRHIRAAASYAFSDFADYHGFTFDTTRLSDERSYALGIEHDRALRLLGAWLPVRLSFNYQQLPFDHPAGERVNKYLFSLGSGFQVYGGRGKIDFAFQIGRAGAIADNGLEDRLVRLYVSLSGSEAWQRRGAGGTEIGR